MTNYELGKLEEAGEAYLEAVSEKDWQGYDLERLMSYGKVALGLLSNVQFFHCTLPIFGPQIEAEGLVSNKQVLRSKTVDALTEVYSRFRPDVDHSKMYLGMNLTRGLTRSGLLYFSTARHIAERSSYGVPESARDAIASLRAAAGLDPSANYGVVAQSETDRLLVGGDSTKRIIVFGPTHPALVTTLLFATKQGMVEKVIHDSGVEWLNGYFEERNLEVAVPIIEPEHIVEAYDHDVRNNNFGFSGSYRELLEQTTYFVI